MRLKILHEADQYIGAPRYNGRGVREVTFDYGGHKVDPRPNILFLGKGQNPHSGNDIVGGINLNYLRSHPRLAGMENIIRRNLEKLYGKSFDELMSGLNSDLLPRARAMQLLFRKNGVGQHLRDVYRTYTPNKMANLFYGDYLTPLSPDDYDGAQEIEHDNEKKDQQYARKIGQKTQERAIDDIDSDVEPEDIGEPEEKIKQKEEERKAHEKSVREIKKAEEEEEGTISSPERRKESEEPTEDSEDERV